MKNDDRDKQQLNTEYAGVVKLEDTIGQVVSL